MGRSSPASLARHAKPARVGFWPGFIVAGLLSFFVASQIILRLRRKLNPQPMPARLAPFLSQPFRSRMFGTAEQIIERAGVRPGMRVLEIGPGPGHFTVPLARRVVEEGKDGSITCVEIQQEMIEMLHQRLHAEQISNIEVIQGDAQQLPLPADSFDMVFLVTVVGEVPDESALFRECARVLKPGGIVAVTEQISDPDYRFPGTVRQQALNAGLQDAGYTGFRWWSYTARYRKP
ncbi:MAG: class I SAM-dependent methyltransferase [Ktedonobacteraceae bacterium]|nr:class I SAM-dependent methyltransferase [Ktedonobacteraceae bacterium]